jgi:hypothetical protein
MKTVREIEARIEFLERVYTRHICKLDMLHARKPDADMLEKVKKELLASLNLEIGALLWVLQEGGA